MYWLIRALRRHITTLRFKLLLIGEMVVIVGVLALFIPMRAEFRNQIIQDMQRQLQAIAATSALQIDGDLHTRIQDESDWHTEAFATLHDRLIAIGEANPDLNPEHIYTFRADGDSVRFVVFTHDFETSYRPRIGEGFPLQPGMASVLAGGEPVVRDLYTDQYGEWISAYVPIRCSSGRVDGLLEVDISSDEYFRRYDRLTKWMIVVGILAVCLSSVLGWFVLNRLVIRPVKAIHDGMEALSRQDFSHKTMLQTGDEFQDLGATLNTISTDLNAARIVQTGFFPRELPATDRNKIAAAWLPCDATAGDYYDVIPLGDDRLALVIADVAGHGLGPSLLMSACRSALRTLATMEFQPYELVERLESQIEDDIADGCFITLVYGILGADGSFSYCNAGHSPALARIDGKIQTLESHCLPLGMRLSVDTKKEKQSAVQLSRGDRIFLASDGIAEAINPDGEFFGDERIFEIVGMSNGSCEKIVEQLCQEVGEHVEGASFTDDITMLCVERVAPED